MKSVKPTNARTHTITGRQCSVFVCSSVVVRLWLLIGFAGFAAATICCNLENDFRGMTDLLETRPLSHASWQNLNTSQRLCKIGEMSRSAGAFWFISCSAQVSYHSHPQDLAKAGSGLSLCRAAHISSSCKHNMTCFTSYKSI